MIYLTTPPEARNNADGVGDLNIGIIIRPQHRRKGYAAKAIQLALDHAFKTIRCHRVQAIIVNPFSYAKYPSYRTFTSIGFKQEGVRRCSYFNVFDGEYQDTAYMGVLDTEWLATEGGSAARPTPWDELLRRHDQERVTIMRWEERMTDSDETETVHHFPLDHDAPNESGGDQPEQPSRVSSRATTPDFHFDSQSADPFQTNDPSSSAPSEHSSSPLSIASNWDMMDEFSSYDEMESEAELSNHDG
ncbi:hypothetical protein AX15_005994 [Amanita polypyramis BW_CC]|nr:hypothetical protein AX15_005994 [Amanita polypyramis BW_CC]